MCVARQVLDDGPIMLRVRFPAHCDLAALGAKVGMALRLEKGDLLLGNAIRFDMSRSTAWIPPMINSMASAREVSRRLRTLVSQLHEAIPDEGMAPLLPYAEDFAYGNSVGLSCDSETARLAFPSVRRLVQGICEGDWREIDYAVVQIVGLGPGLTPSGDDLLGGAILGLNAVIDAYICEEVNGTFVDSGWPEIISFAAESIVRHASGTTDISAALLRHAANGVASASIHMLLLKLLRPECAVNLMESALAVASAGHTSGWDSLAGLALGMHLGLRIIDEDFTNPTGCQLVAAAHGSLSELKTR